MIQIAEKQINVSQWSENHAYIDSMKNNKDKKMYIEGNQIMAYCSSLGYFWFPTCT